MQDACCWTSFFVRQPICGREQPWYDHHLETFMHKHIKCMKSYLVATFTCSSKLHDVLQQLFSLCSRCSRLHHLSALIPKGCCAKYLSRRTRVCTMHTLMVACPRISMQQMLLAGLQNDRARPNEGTVCQPQSWTSSLAPNHGCRQVQCTQSHNITTELQYMRASFHLEPSFGCRQVRGWTSFKSCAARK